MQLYHYHSIDSTQKEAVRLLDAQQTRPPFYVVASTQTEGRGRFDRRWQSVNGNVHVTFILPWQHKQLSLLAGLAVHAALVELGVSAGDLQLKWPNDVLYKEQKIAGLLCQLHAGCSLVGIGVNTAHAPDPADVRFPATSLAAYTLSAEQVIDGIAEQLEHVWQQLHEQGEGWLQQTWLQKAWRWQQEITLLQGEAACTGMFAGLDPQGHMLLQTAQGMQTIAAGDMKADA